MEDTSWMKKKFIRWMEDHRGLILTVFGLPLSFIFDLVMQVFKVVAWEYSKCEEANNGTQCSSSGTGPTACSSPAPLSTGRGWRPSSDRSVKCNPVICHQSVESWQCDGNVMAMLWQCCGNVDAGKHVSIVAAVSTHGAIVPRGESTRHHCSCWAHHSQGHGHLALSIQC